MKRELGSLSEKYESAGRGPGVISSGVGDPGGKSYGCYQLASKTGTLQAYIKSSKFKEYFGDVPLTSTKFDILWKALAKNSPEDFKKDQHEFIKRTHFDGPYKYWTKELNMLDTPTIQQVIWSISVQHGRVKTILANTSVSLRKYDKPSEEIIIKELYKQRTLYVSRFLQGKLLRSLKSRYINEEKDALDLMLANFKLYVSRILKVTNPD